ncbi:DUF3077 domain-containing protein [Pseudomonas gingeri NCPPB 3146 = LMG 5327]|uniref:DUF3077 domain-containing protein n=2 Tax=Pseudomonas gingeri TaxID=117681 RepID=A0A7Y7Y1W7_9PSED|nr:MULTISPECIES: DUF3077 domain-containing protein [Pseudomonas]NVZ26475.1 DUF3077 domain-containing protein [Pseudomonas gingeri]NWC16419.1 DUF3077 domain-containing protein [Pseudomonas gingeri]PNQ92114.1 DUF3077 domain-containing protein [Pseudomonas gingeri NCPPB 3146 = LMG 5327]BBP75893.1 hypothetical protein PHLH7_19970 [Pseudomonas sp. Ost2]
MTSTPKHMTDFHTMSPCNSLKGRHAAQRALDYYLKPSVSGPLSDEGACRPDEDKLFAVRENLSVEEAMVHASDLLRCAAATAYEAADALQGSSRDLAFSVVYMVDMAKAMVDRALSAECPGM